jgi:hypothetical protein
MAQGKRKDQEEFSSQMTIGAMVGITAIILFCLVAVVIEEVCGWL